MHPIVSQIIAEDRIAQRHQEAERYRRAASSEPRHVTQPYRAAVARGLSAVAAWIETAPATGPTSIRPVDDKRHANVCEPTVIRAS